MLKWTSQPPTETGYYHWRQHKDALATVVQVRLGEGIKNSKRLRMYLLGNDNSFGLGTGEWWPVPIAPPQEPKLTVTRIGDQGTYCPTQWTGEDDQGRYVYARYRWGRLTVEADDELVLSLGYGDGMSGVMSFDELKALTQGVIEWPEYETPTEEE